jgi:lipoyl-dependent peroxiredoxin
MNIERKANAVWQGGLKDGAGTVTTERKALNETPYNFSGRFAEGTTGTNPEELIGAALSGCFSMALSGQIAERGMTPERIETTARVKLERTDAGPSVTGVHLEVIVRAPGADEGKFKEATEAAKTGCPMSRLLAPGTTITMDAKLA